MSMLTYIASDAVLKEAAIREEPDFSHESWDDGFCIVPLEGAVDDVWTEKKYTAALEWDYSEQRARYVIDYLREVLERTDEAEVWHIWMGFGERAIVRTRHLTVDTIAPADLQCLGNGGRDPGAVLSCRLCPEEERRYDGRVEKIRLFRLFFRAFDVDKSSPDMVN